MSMFAPRLLVLVWLGFLAVTMWAHSSRTLQPPIFDAISYYQKACTFWAAVAQGHLANPLALEPRYRPPGTILMSFPFGMEADFRGFYFRSAFLPVALMALAVYWCGANGWLLLLLVMSLTTLPCFYHWDAQDYLKGVSFWGMVDNFEAAVAALAVGAMVRSLRARSLWWLVLAGVLGVYCLMLKASGLLVMALLAASWLLVCGLARAEGSYLRNGGLLLLSIYLPCCLLAFHSDYLSAAHNTSIAPTRYAAARQAVTRAWRITTGDSATWEYLQNRNALYRFHITFGEVVPLSCLVLLAAFPWWRRRALLERTDLVLLVCGFGIFAIGLFYWVLIGRFEVVRYFTVFGTMAFCCMVPAVLSLVQRLPGRAARALALLYAIPAVALGWQLCEQDPSPTWQALLGVHVGVGSPQIPQRVVEFAVAAQPTDRVYALDAGLSAALMNSASFCGFYPTRLQRVLLNQEPRRFNLVWSGQSRAVHLQELIESNYLLIKDLDADTVAKLLRMDGVGRLEVEQSLLSACLITSDGYNGTSVSARLPSARLLRVDDRRRLDEFLKGMLIHYRWSSDFWRENWQFFTVPDGHGA